MNVFRIILILLFFLIQSNAFSQENDSVFSDTLGVAEVTVKRIQRGSTVSSLVVSNKIRNKYFNALAMLKEFSIVRYNSINEQVTINGASQIAYQIDGQDKSLEDVKNLPLNAIKRVEICHQVDGIHVAEGIRYVVNIVLKEDYKGLDLSARNFLIVSPAGNNGNDFVACEQPGLAMEIRNNRWDINVGAGYGRFDWNFPIVIEKEYNGTTWQSSHVTPRHPNQYTTRNSFFSQLAVDYKINENNFLSLNALYAPSSYDERTKLVYSNLLNRELSETEENLSETKENDLKFNLNYRGQIQNNWSLGLNTGFNYAFYDNAYSFTDLEKTATSSFEQRKRYFYSKIFAQYTGFNRLKLDLGAIYTYNSYKTQQTLSTARINSNRYNVFAFATYNVSDNCSMRAGLSSIGVNSDDERHFNLQPNFNLNYTSPNEEIVLDLEYTMAPNYPKMYQLSDAGYKLDQVITHRGNPNLKPLTSSHQFLGGITCWGITLQSGFEYNKNGISNFYYQNEKNESFLSYQNARIFNNSTMLSYSLDLSSKFSIDAELGFHYSLIDSRNFPKKHKANLLGNLALNYYNEQKALGVSLEYSKNKQTSCTLQGQRDENQDLFSLTLQKVWMDGRLRCQFEYVLPIHCGLITWQREYVDAGFYKMKQSFDMGTYDNMCFIRLSYRFHKGKSTTRVADTGIYDDETKARRKSIGSE